MCDALEKLYGEYRKYDPPSSHPTLCEDAKKASGPGADPMVSVPCCQLTTSHTDQKTCLTLPISRIAMQGKGAKKP